MKIRVISSPFGDDEATAARIAELLQKVTFHDSARKGEIWIRGEVTEAEQQKLRDKGLQFDILPEPTLGSLEQVA